MVNISLKESEIRVAVVGIYFLWKSTSKSPSLFPISGIDFIVKAIKSSKNKINKAYYKSILNEMVKK